MSAPPKSPTVTEIVYFRLKPSIKPEDSDNHEGEKLLDLFRETILESGHLGSAWGRSLEDENNLVWVIEWADATNSIQLSRLEPFIDNDGDSSNKYDPTKLITFFTTLNPPISTTETLTTNPVTELVNFLMPSDISAENLSKFNRDIVTFRNETQKVQPADIKPVSWSMGHVERPVTIDHRDTPSGKAKAYFMAIGWQSKEKHTAARETKEFKETVAPLRTVMVSPVKGLEMRHVKFQKIGF
ncbi:hypothetical protein BGW36DRAFT_392603 [Talaromyces proteolyticus]|uniref:ABM domain-containing protein n=1 Tax=Talaromyces proteolyticus TaxID=1131652 RepID=A0AAD4Q5Z6_9EURO|nr:uncharacterized protein BGW36DRAFT_392603 [Talaromyces proteolyticus]KAH8704847.1 hypothetical protein BGW36DRAFT_392603 [Talaromyces proteolyticus]